MAADSAFVSAHAAAPPRRAPASGLPTRTDRNPVRAQDRHSLACTALGARLRLGDDLLETAARLAARWGLATTAGVFCRRAQTIRTPGRRSLGSGLVASPG